MSRGYKAEMEVFPTLIFFLIGVILPKWSLGLKFVNAHTHRSLSIALYDMKGHWSSILANKDVNFSTTKQILQDTARLDSVLLL